MIIELRRPWWTTSESRPVRLDFMLEREGDVRLAGVGDNGKVVPWYSLGDTEPTQEKADVLETWREGLKAVPVDDLQEMLEDLDLDAEVKDDIHAELERRS